MQSGTPLGAAGLRDQAAAPLGTGADLDAALSGNVRRCQRCVIRRPNSIRGVASIRIQDMLSGETRDLRPGDRTTNRIDACFPTGYGPIHLEKRSSNGG